MHDDPFARAVHRAEAAEHARVEDARNYRRGVVSKWSRTGFRVHFTVYIAISVMLILIWLMTSTAFPWPFIVIAGWGAGVGAHWSATRELMTPTPPRPKADPDPFSRAIPNAPAPAPAATPVATPEPTVARSGPATSKADELAKLAKLHKSGALTDDEFRTAKAELLGT